MNNNSKNTKFQIALIVVDYQNDFIDGSLALSAGTAGQNAEDALEHINSLLKEHKEISLVVYTRDAHPENHISFFNSARNPDRKILSPLETSELKMFDSVQFEGRKSQQALYPCHCVVGTPGFEFHKKLNIVPRSIIIDKGKQTAVESYSAFLDNDRIIDTGLTQALKDSDINVVLVCGIALDICVAATALDAVKLGFKTAIAIEACKGLDMGGIKKAMDDFRANAIPILSTEDSLKLLRGELVPQEWV